MKLITVLPLLLLTGMLCSISQADDNVHLTGALVAEPCKLPDVDADIHLDFGTIVSKYLYQYQRTKSVPFSIHLTDCDPALMSTVAVSFEGTADDELTTLFMLEQTSAAKGVALGIEDADGNTIPVNNVGAYTPLVKGGNELQYNAFIQAKPTALSDKNITEGDFAVIGKFVLHYQ